MDERPTITKQEVSWHATCAAIRARKAASAQGMDPQAKIALVHAAAEGQAPMPMISMGTLWAMEAIEPVAAALCGGIRNADQALVCHTLLHPEPVLLALLCGDVESVQEGLLETAFTLAPDRATAMDQWFAEEMQRLGHLSGGEAVVPVKKN